MTDALTDLEALRKLAAHVRHLPIEDELSNWLGAKQMALQLTSHPRRLARTGARGEYLVGDSTAMWHTRSAGAVCLSLAALNPHRWLTLRPGRTRRAWHASIDAAVESLARLDSALADAFAFGEHQQAPGLRLRVQDGHVQLMWRPPHRLVLEVSAP
ncbi:MAG: hypothetical protein ABI605_16745 [Rhizobacter sp.]